MRYHYFFISIFLLFVSGYCLHRDIKIENGYPVDIANRVIGARLQMDNQVPYFYSWKAEDGLRYYNPRVYNTDSGRVSLITASPFFHHLLYPIANLEQRQISRIWLGIEYFMLMACMLIAFSFTINVAQKWAIAFFFSLLLFAEGWMMHIAYGQMYIIIPALAFSFLFCMNRNKQISFVFFAGLVLAIMVFIKPTLILFFLPFVFLVKKFSTKNILLFLAPIIIISAYSLLNKNERSYWQGYQKTIALHIKVHLGLKGKESAEASSIQYKKWEGWDMDSIDKAHADFPVKLQVERCNIWMILQETFHAKISLTTINIVLLFVISVAMLLFYFYHRNNQYLSFTILAIFGFSLYTISEYLSPITRFEYYSVQCAFPCFLIAAFYNKKIMPIYIFLLFGLLLNIFDFPFIIMRHTVGQMMILFASLWLCFSSKSKSIS